MDANRIRQLMQANSNQYNYFGLRSMTPNPVTNESVSAQIGDMPRNSYHWIDGESTGQEINGVCAIDITDANTAQIAAALKSMPLYDGNQIVLIGSRNGDCGDDAGEIVMRGDETILAVWNK